MSTIVRTNINSMYANRNLGKNNTKVSKSLDKLSSGYAINKAADDASGLGVSEKMKAQITGLDQAYKNTQEGVSLVQTAEGATTEIHNMLNRMVELSTKAANGTIADEVDRDAIQVEIRTLCDEIDRISLSTTFNGVSLLNGDLSGDTTISADSISLDAPAASSISFGESLYASFGNFDYSGTTGSANEKLTFELSWDEEGETKTSTIDIQFGLDSVPTITITDENGTSSILGSTATTNGADTEADADIVGATIDEAIYAAVGNTDELTMLDSSTIIGSPYVSNIQFTITAGVLNFDISQSGQSELVGVNEILGLDKGDTFSIADKTYAFEPDGLMGIDVSTIADNDVFMATSLDGLAEQIQEDTGLAVTVGTDGASIILADAVAYDPDKGLTMQIGASSKEYDRVTIQLNDLGAESIGVASVDVTSQENALDSLSAVREAIDFVSDTRSYLGALQNRLEYASNNLSNTSENLQAANSKIRDTDMASELMEYTRMSILTESAQSMLAQANNEPNQVLSLLG